jgi:hypothetical protein
MSWTRQKLSEILQISIDRILSVGRRARREQLNVERADDFDPEDVDDFAEEDLTTQAWRNVYEVFLHSDRAKQIPSYRHAQQQADFAHAQWLKADREGHENIEPDRPDGYCADRLPDWKWIRFFTNNYS